MPHWSDIARRHGSLAPADAAHPPQGPVRPRSPAAASMPAVSVPVGSLDALLKERRMLEARMQKAVTGGAGAVDPRDALRFQVAPMAERRAEIARWAAPRDTRKRDGSGEEAIPEPRATRLVQGSHAAVARDGLPLRDRMRENQPDASGPVLPLRATPGETAGGTPTGAAGFLSRRGAALRKPRVGADDAQHSLEARLTRARAVASRQIGAAKDEIGRQIASLDRQLEQANRRLAAEGHAGAGDDLRAMRVDAGLDGAMDKARTGRDTLGKAGRMIEEGPGCARRKVADDWAARRDAIAGPDMAGFERPLRAMHERALGMSLDAFDQRARAARASAGAHRKSARDEAQADDRRRERALANRRTTRDAD
jgi:hypothetical protein